MAGWPIGRAGDGVVLRRVVVGVLATNCWLVHAESDLGALLVDPGDDPDAILAAVERHHLDVCAIVLTHAHFDHVLAVPELTAALGVAVLAHPAEAPTWPAELAYLREHGHWDAGTATAVLRRTDPTALLPPTRPLWNGVARPVEHGHRLPFGPLTATVLHTPGHTPGSITLAVGRHLLTGDTLFPGGPGLTGEQWPGSDFPTIMRSVELLMARPDTTVVHPGHGRSTTLGAERPRVPGWRARGW